MAKPIYSKRDPLTGDGLEVSIDGDRVLIATTTPGRPKRLTVLCDLGEGLRLAEAIHDALTIPSRSGSGPRAPRVVRL